MESEKSAVVQNVQPENRSQFNGKLLGYLGICLLYFFLCLITIGFAMPWFICRLQRWKIQYTIIDGKRLIFDGKGSKLFWRYVWWTFLTVITLGCYSWWRGIKIQDWLTERTHLVWEDGRIFRGKYVAARSRFCGDVVGYVLITIWQSLLIIFTLGIATPWANCMFQRWLCKNTVIDEEQLIFEGKGRKYFWRCLAWFFLTLITLGIFGLWVPIKQMKWMTKNTHFDIE
jgi:uncharacterized membrane protein YjgN (DUF898 family)